MRINAIVESHKYNERREYSNASVYNTKHNNNNAKESFAEVLKNAKRDLYLRNKVKRVV